MFQTAIRGPVGFSPEPNTARVKNLSGASIEAGDCVALDIAGTQPEVANSGEGGLAWKTPVSSSDRGSRYGAVVGVSATPSFNQYYGIFVVALEAAADNAMFEAQISGELDALVYDNDVSPAVVQGDDLAAYTSDTHLWNRGTSGMKVLAIAIEDTAGSPSRTRVLFNGWSGFGQVQ
ncbi:MAG: hypothetical protein D6746_08495 [Bacteroidetes bacterium]|nr:MAG: hypothetical protein D6746_08495 [Bacteroidota bacterium]